MILALTLTLILSCASTWKPELEARVSQLTKSQNFAPAQLLMRFANWNCFKAIFPELVNEFIRNFFYYIMIIIFKAIFDKKNCNYIQKIFFQI
jgi:hypothetical protein